MYKNRFAEKINDSFAIVVAYQFVYSSLTTCLTIFKLSTTAGSGYINSLYVNSMYLDCLLIQLMMYCIISNYFKEKVRIYLTNL